VRFSLAQLEAFYWTARLGTVSAASRHLNLTQPTLSLRIKEFERLLDLKLFHRRGRSLVLTSHGASLLPRAEQMVAMAGDIERYGRRAAPRQTILRIGAADLFAMTCLPRLVRNIERANPTITLAASVGFSHTISDILAAGSLDVSFITNFEANDTHEAIPLGDIPLAWMAPTEFGLKDSRLTPGDLANHHILTNPRPSHLYTTIHAWFSEAGSWPVRVSTCNTLSVIAQLSAEGIGVTVLPVAMPHFDAWAHRLRLLTVEPPLESHRLYAVFVRGRKIDGLEEVIAEAQNIVRYSPLFTEISGTG
jgi:DNA-binding transcriptional LysR family regulator